MKSLSMLRNVVDTGVKGSMLQALAPIQINVHCLC